MHIIVIQCHHDKHVDIIIFKQIRIGKFLDSGFIDSWITGQCETLA